MATSTRLDRQEISQAEEMQLAVACIWQGAELHELGLGRLLEMPSGYLNVLAQVNAAPAELPELVTIARGRHAQVLVEPASMPPNLARYLQSHGFYPRRVSLIMHCRPDWRSRYRPSVVDVREVTAEGVGEWHQVFTAAFAAPQNDPAFSEQASRQAYSQLGGRSRWLLGCLHGEPVGCAVLYAPADAGLLMAVGTIPRARRRGVAAAVVHYALQAFWAAGGRWMFLETSLDNPARKLYHQCGFRPAYRRVLYMAEPGR